MPYTQVSSLDYADIKSALKSYLRENTDFTDYDFESSTLSAILDLLAYNTYYTAFNTTMAVNEAFLDSASLRDNVIKIAKQLGYTPKSKTSSQATVSLSVDVSGFSVKPTFVTLKKGNCFIASNPNNRSETYQFAVLEDITAAIQNNKAVFSNIPGGSLLTVTEGIYINYKFTVDQSITNQRFIIPTENIDTSTINVFIRDNISSNKLTKYSKADNILNVSANDKIFFVQETSDNRFELVFGDGVIGRKLTTGEVIEVSYLTSSGKDANDAKFLVFSGEIYDQNGTRILNGITVSTVSSAEGGEDEETVESIKKNAPLFYSSQNRAVTLEDYKAIVRKIFPAAQDIIVYGGEEEQPPEYGRVKIAIKPKFSTKISNSTKAFIRTELKKYTVASVIPVIIDPSITEVILDSKVFYNPNATSLTPEEVKILVIQNLESYKQTYNLNKFGGSIKQSKISSVIDASEDSINSNQTKLLLKKTINPAISTKAQYLICFNNEIYAGCNETVLTSTNFRVAEYPNVDVYFDNGTTGNIRICTNDLTTGNKVVLQDDVGNIDFLNGKIFLNNLTIISGSNDNNEIFITLPPASPDVVAVREVYLELSLEGSTFQIIPERN